MDSSINLSELDLRHLSHPDINSNKQFVFLKSELESYYKGFLSSNQSFSPYKLKSIYKNLIVVLTEVIRTKDSFKRLELLDNINKWYLNKLSKPLPTNFDRPVAETSSPKLFRTDRTPTFISKKVPVWSPKTKVVSREEILQKINKKYLEMQSSEVIRLKPKQKNSKKTFDAIKSIKESITPLKEYGTNSSTIIRSNNSFKIYSKSPNVYDFRSSSHKTRLIAQPKLNALSRLPEMSEIFTIKQKMALKSQLISTKSLQNALGSFGSYPIDEKKLEFPKGGEFLLKSSQSP
jgi:hypothetical protein